MAAATAMNGEEITLDGTDQLITLKASDELKARASRGLPTTVNVLVSGAGGAQVSNEAIAAGHKLWPTNAVVPITTWGTFHIKGTNTQKATISY